jgi:hypothetical protein
LNLSNSCAYKSLCLSGSVLSCSISAFTPLPPGVTNTHNTHGVHESLAIGYFTEGWKSPTMSEEEILGHVRNAYRAEKNNFGTLEFNVY